VTSDREAMNSMFLMAYGIFEGEFERRLYRVLHTPKKRKITSRIIYSPVTISSKNVKTC
jgi:hypothetical protein